MSHTPGLWTIRKQQGNSWSILGKVPANDVDMIGAPVECRLADVHSIEANAHLIAATPELLEACKAAYEKEMDRCDSEDVSPTNGYALMLKNAIAKATSPSDQ
jgi:hypothetical protein